MKIINNYDGASIDIVENNVTKNEAILSLRKEQNYYSNYYNFIVDNNSSSEGIIYIRNYNQLLFQSDAYIPFYRTLKGSFIRMEEEKINKTEDELIIKIKPYENIEISLYPRYVEEDLKKYLETIKTHKKVKLINDTISKIVIGDSNLKAVVITSRLHPAETLSSYFLEGLINEILSDEKYISNYCYIIFPIVNITGVKNGNHRYSNNLDYNRIWNKTSNAREIEYIKKELENYNIHIFIDIHGDEISKIDYIRSNNKNLETKISNFKILQDSSKLRRFIRAIVRQGKMINILEQTAREYISKMYGCMGILVELSLINNDIESSKEKGAIFINELTGGSND